MRRPTPLLLLLAACGGADPVPGQPDGGGGPDPSDAAAIDRADARPGTPDAGPGGLPALGDGLVRGVDESFWRNADDFVERVAASDVQLYWTLLDGNAYGEPDQRDLGRQIILQPDSFFANVLVPLLDRYGSTGAIWAIDCINEPEAMIAGPDGNYQSWGVTWEEMRVYLAACAAVVHERAPGVKVSAGSGWHGHDNLAAGRFDGLGFDFLDFHMYDDAPEPPTAAAVGGGLPVVIGECGQASTSVDDELQLAAVSGCFAAAEAGDYLAALAWYYDQPGSTNQHGHVRADGSWRPVRQAYEAMRGPGHIPIGLNLAWLGGAYDHDFGLNQLHPEWGVSYDGEAAQAMIDDYDELAIDLMRVWAFERHEGLVFDAVHDGFEDGPADWTGEGEGVVVVAAAAHPDDGAKSLVVSMRSEQVGWHGISKRWPADRPLDLSRARAWRYHAASGLGQGVGVNLAFVTGGGAVYQTRAPGQYWIADGDEGELTVSLAESDFADNWALESAPDVGAAWPGLAQLRDVRELRVRIHLGADQLPADGELYLDGIWLR